MKINWITVILALALIGMIVLFTKSCNQIDSIKTDLDKKKFSSDSLLIVTKKIFHENDSISGRNRIDSIGYAKKIDSLQNLYSGLSQAFGRSKQTLQELSEKYRIAISKNDSGSAIEICDSLIQILAIARDELIQVQGNRDSIISYQSSEIAKLYTEIGILQNEISDLKNSYLTQKNLFDQAISDSDKLLRQKKRNGLIAKIELVLLAALGIFASLKK